MVAAPSELRLVRSRREDPCPAGCTGVHSYTSDDIRWCLPGGDPAKVAIDVELTDAPPPKAIKDRLHTDEDFWRAWTRLEVVAKLSDTPVHTLLGQFALGRPAPHHIQVSYLPDATATICIGCRS